MESWTTHTHSEGMMHSVSRRYFRRLELGQRSIIEHHMNRTPVVDAYELLPLPAAPVTGPVVEPLKVLVFWGHDEIDPLRHAMGGRIPRGVLGTSLETLLREHGVSYEDDDGMNDVIEDFMDAFFRQPDAGDITYKLSTWVEQHSERTVAEAKRRGEWDDLRVLWWASKLIAGGTMTVGTPPVTVTPFVNVQHLSYNHLQVVAAADLGMEGTPPAPRQFIDVLLVVEA